jgi:hypothetical protein
LCPFDSTSRLAGLKSSHACRSRAATTASTSGKQKTLGEKDGGRWIDKTHFVVAGGQVKSMLSWLGYMKHGEPQERVIGLKMPQPNLKLDFDDQARGFVDRVVDDVFGQRSA